MNNIYLLIQLSRIIGLLLAFVGMGVIIYDYNWSKRTERQLDMQSFLTANGLMKKPEIDYLEYWKRHKKNLYTALVLFVIALPLCLVQLLPKARIYDKATKELIQEHKLDNSKQR